MIYSTVCVQRDQSIIININEIDCHRGYYQSQQKGIDALCTGKEEVVPPSTVFLIPLIGYCSFNLRRCAAMLLSLRIFVIRGPAAAELPVSVSDLFVVAAASFFCCCCCWYFSISGAGFDPKEHDVSEWTVITAM